MKSINRNLKIAIISLIAAIAAMCVAMGITLISSRVGIKLFQNSVMIIVAIESCILVSQYFVVKKYNNGRFSFDFIDMRLRQNSFKQLFIGIGIGMLMVFNLVLVLSVMKIIKYKGIGFMFCPANKVILAIISAFVISVFAGFTEEILIRGIILKSLMKFKGKIFALIISSLVFGMFHTRYYNNFYAIFYVFISGILFGYLYIITGSLYLSIGLHFSSDFFSSIIGVSNNFLLFDVLNPSAPYDIFIQIFISLILILGLALYRYKNKKISVDIEI